MSSLKDCARMNRRGTCEGLTNAWLWSHANVKKSMDHLGTYRKHVVLYTVSLTAVIITNGHDV